MNKKRIQPYKILALFTVIGLLATLIWMRPDPDARRAMAWRSLAHEVAQEIEAGLEAGQRPDLVPSEEVPEAFLALLDNSLRPHGKQDHVVLVELQPLESTHEVVQIRIIRRLQGKPSEIVKRHPIREVTSVFPTFVAIAAALILRRTLLPLLLGIFLGSLLLEEFNMISATRRVVVQYFFVSATTQFYFSLILFILGLIGMVGIGIRSGGVRGMVDAILSRTRSKRGIRLLGPCLGFLIFFDDYSNTVVIGNAMRPITDRLRIPREKLAYIVDSTAAPVAGLMFFSTWIWYEVSQIQGPLTALGAINTPDAAYGVFLTALPFRFYCIFTLAFVLLNAILNRDFGPMREAELRAAGTGQVIRDGCRPLLGQNLSGLREKPGIPHRWWNMAIPLAFTMILILTGLIVFREPGQALGGPERTGIILASSALSGAVLAGCLVVAQRLLTPWEAVSAFFSGLRAAMLAICILFMAWAIGSVCEDLGTAEYLSAGLEQGFPPVLLPVVLFLLAAIISFSIGSSFSTMAILLPIGVPLVYTLSQGAGLVPLALTVIAIAAVLDGAIFGDHCSPISDTTVLSSISSGSDHLDHVQTQLPYALSTMALAVFAGYLPVLLGIAPWIAILAGLAGCWGILRILGKKNREAAP